MSTLRCYCLLLVLFVCRVAAETTAIISLIDDDTLRPDDVALLHKACIDNGIVATYACITSRGSLYPGFFELLHSCEDDGFQVVLHCNEQKNYYRWSQNMDMETALGILDDEGFKGFRYFVAPYGSQDEGLQEIAREHGQKCLVSISNDDYLCNDSQYTPYNIPRVGFNATDGGTSTMSRLKEHIAAVSATGGWLLVGTHIYNGWTEALLETRFKEFVDYAKEKGLKFVTLKEGFEIYSTTSGNRNFPPVPSAVNELEQGDVENDVPGECYDILGRRLEKPQRGLYIIRVGDGSAKMFFRR